MKLIISSYPNEHYKSKHVRFKDDDICMCPCDCDFILSFANQKKGELCSCCSEGDHEYPKYVKHLKKVLEL